jgi:hypothetical protein
MRNAGFLSPSQVASRLGIARTTVALWARKCLDGQDSRLSGVQRTFCGYILIPAREVDRLRKEQYGE